MVSRESIFGVYECILDKHLELYGPPDAPKYFL